MLSRIIARRGAVTLRMFSSNPLKKDSEEGSYMKFEDPVLNKNLHSSISDYDQDEE